MDAAAQPRVGKARGPNSTSGHTATIKAEAKQLKAEGNKIIAGGGKPEKVILTPNGAKDSRRPDILYRTPEGEMRGVNVGRKSADGSPIPREQPALDDLNGPGKLPTIFIPYR